MSSGEALIHLEFEKCAERTPHTTAVVCGEESLTYRQLNQKANEWARHLHHHGVVHGRVVALALGPGIDYIVAILAILKCGAAYLPVDTKDPLKRIESFLRAAEVELLITDDVSAYEDLSVTILPSENLTDEIPAGKFERVGSSSGEDKAYIMFTSGTTGTSKGVVVPHRAVLRLVKENNFVDITESDVFFQFAPTSFDASTFEIWGALLNSATLAIYPQKQFDPNKFSSELERNNVTILWLTAALFHLISSSFIQALKPVKSLLAGGDVLRPDCIQRVLEHYPDMTVVNGYGPTENTTFTCCHRMSALNVPTATVPIGMPIKGTSIHIVDEDLQPVPAGEVGELIASGLGVALGYLGGEGSDKSFFKDPNIDSGTVYRTGDLVKQNSSGEIEFVGRRDNQIKVRGFRTSTDEIQNEINRLPYVEESLVISQSNGQGDPLLLGVLQVESSVDVEAPKVSSDLLEFMPAYMMPNKFYFLDKWPLKKNGKVDKNAILTELIK